MQYQSGVSRKWCFITISGNPKIEIDYSAEPYYHKMEIMVIKNTPDIFRNYFKCTVSGRYQPRFKEIIEKWIIIISEKIRLRSWFGRILVNAWGLAEISFYFAIPKWNEHYHYYQDVNSKRYPKLKKHYHVHHFFLAS